MYRTALGLLVAVLALALAASCAALERRGTPPAGSPQGSAQPAGPTAKPSAKPTKKPKPIVPVVPAKLPRQTGTGPHGSMLATGSSSVALTFDDGPDPIFTPKMLDVLKRNGAKATFCVVGKRVEAYPALVRRIVAEGHTICNHSWAHSMTLREETDKIILADLRATNAAIHAASPRARIKYFRAPGGYFDARLVKIAASLDMRSLYWSVDTRDWEWRRYGRGASMVDHIVACILTMTRRGSIILAHDFRKPDTVTAFGKVLPWLKSNVKLIALPT